MCDRLYFEEISYESVIDVYQREKPKVCNIIGCFGVHETKGHEGTVQYIDHYRV